MRKSVIIGIILSLIYIPVSSKEITLDQKIKELFWKTNWTDIVNRCNKYAKSPRKCKITKWFIWWNESTFFTNAYKHNGFWINKKWVEFKSDIESIEDFNIRYNKYWYKNTWPWYFYSNSAKNPPKSRFCMSEYQTDGRLLQSCPNGLKNATFYYTILSNLK